MWSNLPAWFSFNHGSIHGVKTTLQFKSGTELFMCYHSVIYPFLVVTEKIPIYSLASHLFHANFVATVEASFASPGETIIYMLFCFDISSMYMCTLFTLFFFLRVRHTGKFIDKVPSAKIREALCSAQCHFASVTCRSLIVQSCDVSPRSLVLR